jgi:hypothetical protein
MSVLCQERQTQRSKNGPLFNYLVGGGKKRLRDYDIEQTCCLGGYGVCANHF